jgi:uncharacterized membrane-anchored protein YjiN (DUF445 family)
LTATAGEVPFSGAPPQPDQNRKLADLQRMQRLATSLLCAMLALLLASAAFQSAYPWLHWVRAFAEAGTVGAFADLFAVVALFRHPLGLPIPHTAIIPTNKDRIAENLGLFIANHFLTKENVRSQLEAHNTVSQLAQWLDDPASRRMASQFLIDTIPAILNAVEDEHAECVLQKFARRLGAMDVSPLAGGVLSFLTRDNGHQALFDRSLRALEQWLVANQGVVNAKFSQASAYTPGFLDSYVVEKLVAGTVSLLREIAENPGHEIRATFHQFTIDLIRELGSSADYRRRGQEMTRDIVDRWVNSDDARFLWHAIKKRIHGLLDDRQAAERACERLLAGVSDGLLKRPAVQRELNPWLLNVLEGLVSGQRHRLSILITSVVRSWSAGEVGRRVEIEIGRDLQYIRINGTLMGGAVGLALHALVKVLFA